MTEQPNNVLHIKIDSDQVRPDGAFGLAMLEHIIQNDYPEAVIETKRNNHGLLTDVWIKFMNEADLMQFILMEKQK